MSRVLSVCLSLVLIWMVLIYDAFLVGLFACVGSAVVFCVLASNKSGFSRGSPVFVPPTDWSVLYRPKLK